jgi:hypothetical protein
VTQSVIWSEGSSRTLDGTRQALAARSTTAVGARPALPRIVLLLTVPPPTQAASYASLIDHVKG